jgi:hypothetical protein
MGNRPSGAKFHMEGHLEASKDAALHAVFSTFNLSGRSLSEATRPPWLFVGDITFGIRNSGEGLFSLEWTALAQVTPVHGGDCTHDGAVRCSTERILAAPKFCGSGHCS